MEIWSPNHYKRAGDMRGMAEMHVHIHLQHPHSPQKVYPGPGGYIVCSTKYSWEMWYCSSWTYPERVHIIFSICTKATYFIIHSQFSQTIFTYFYICFRNFFKADSHHEPRIVIAKQSFLSYGLHGSIQSINQSPHQPKDICLTVKRHHQQSLNEWPSIHKDQQFWKHNKHV